MISYTHRRNLPQPVACQRVFFEISFTIGPCRVEAAIDSTPPLISIQEHKYAVYHTLPVFKCGAIFDDCLKDTFSVSYSGDGWLD